jgi:hypothetical protein
MDPVIKIQNYGFRHYSPQNKRWMTVDPIRDGLSWYSYCSNNPINLIDPFGLDEVVANFNVGNENLEIIYVGANGDELTGEVDVYNFTATNNVPDYENPVEYDPDGNESTNNSYYYYPQEFPDSPDEGWNMGYGYTSSIPWVGPAITTNANQEVTTYEYNEATEEWEESGTVIDTGYYVHGGEGDVTWGCIKMDDEDVEDVQHLVNSALNSGGEATLHTTGGKND